MNIFLRNENDVMKELHGLHVSSNFSEEEMSKYSFIDSEMCKNLLAVKKCEVQAPDGHEYFAWIERGSFLVNIHYTCKRILPKDCIFKNYESDSITGFDSRAIKPEEVDEIIKRHIKSSLMGQIKKRINALEVLI